MPHALTVALLAAAAVADTANAQGAADSVRRLDAGWANAYAVHDTAFAQALFADSIVVVGGGGDLKDKNRELGDIRPAPGLTMDFFRTSDVVVRMYPATAVVTGIAEWAYTYQGQPGSTRRRYSATYARGGQLGWQMVALHISPAAQAR